jgi:hypothetical protein
MNDIQRRADDEAWDRKADRRVSDLNQAVEKGLSGEALAALHGLHMAPNEEPPYDVDESSEMDDQETLLDKIISRTIQIGDAISRNRELPDDVKGGWNAMLEKSYPSDGKSVRLLRDLKREVNSWQEIDPLAELSLLASAIDAVATMTEIYQRRFIGVQPQ